MKRFWLLLALAALPAYGFRPSPQPGDRIGILRMSARLYGAEEVVADTIQQDLLDDLRARGFDAYDAGATYGQLIRETARSTGYYVEVVSGRAGGHPVGGAAAATGGVALEVSVVVARVAAEVRLYDARTLELLNTYDLQKRSTAVVPTGIGVAGRSIWAAIALPFLRYGQYRAAAHEVARDAAARIAGS